MDFGDSFCSVNLLLRRFSSSAIHPETWRPIAGGRRDDPVAQNPSHLNLRLIVNPSDIELSRKFIALEFILGLFHHSQASRFELECLRKILKFITELDSWMYFKRPISLLCFRTVGSDSSC